MDTRFATAAALLVLVLAGAQPAYSSGNPDQNERANSIGNTLEFWPARSDAGSVVGAAARRPPDGSFFLFSLHPLDNGLPADLKVEPLRRLHLDGRINNIAFHPTEPIVAATSLTDKETVYGKLAVWNFQSGELLLEIDSLAITWVYWHQEYLAFHTVRGVRSIELEAISSMPSPFPSGYRRVERQDDRVAELIPNELEFGYPDEDAQATFTYAIPYLLGNVYQWVYGDVRVSFDSIGSRLIEVRHLEPGHEQDLGTRFEVRNVPLEYAADDVPADATETVVMGPMTLSDDGHRLAVSYDLSPQNTRWVYLYDTRSGAVVDRRQVGPATEPFDWRYRLRFLPGSHLIMVELDDNRSAIYDTRESRAVVFENPWAGRQPE